MTLFPEIIEGYCSYSIIKRAIENKIIDVKTHNIRDFSLDKHKKVDDTPYGGGGGMVMMCQPVFDCFNSIEKKNDFEFIMLTPQGEKFIKILQKNYLKKTKLSFFADIMRDMTKE